MIIDFRSFGVNNIDVDLVIQSEQMWESNGWLGSIVPVTIEQISSDILIHGWRTMIGYETNFCIRNVIFKAFEKQAVLHHVFEIQNMYKEIF